MMTRLRSAIRIALTLAATAIAPMAASDELGRLFFTPEQRQQLDQRRANPIDERPAVAAQSEESLVTVNGRVTRSSGKTTTWLNGVPQYDSRPAGAADRIRLGAGASRPSVKVGQTLDRTSGAIRDGLQGGSVVVDRRGTQAP